MISAWQHGKNSVLFFVVIVTGELHWITVSLYDIAMFGRGRIWFLHHSATPSTELDRFMETFGFKCLLFMSIAEKLLEKDLDMLVTA